MTRPADFSYSGTELEAVAEATNYYGWIVDTFSAHLGHQAIEAGAGIGTVADLILRRSLVQHLTLIEPARENVAVLEERFKADGRVRIHHGYLEDLAGSIPVDSIIAVNVLEHVEKDADFLRAAHATLVPGGTLLLLVPAVPLIFGSLDRAFEHFRRYTRSGLRARLLDAGFEVRSLYYLNMLGVAAWFVSGRLLRRSTLGRRQVRFYDRWVIPVLRAIETRFVPPVGQSLLAVAWKPRGTN